MRKILFSVVFVGALAMFANAQTPRTLREFFNLLPQKYFTLEGCVADPTKANCDKARSEYIENYLEVEDTANGYWKSGCDGAQSCLTMALFKRPNGTYIVALFKEFEESSENHFLQYSAGKWSDISASVIPQFSKNNIYELPQNGTTIAVFGKNKNGGKANNGKKLYDLVWKSGKFSVKK